MKNINIITALLIAISSIFVADNRGDENSQCEPIDRQYFSASQSSTVGSNVAKRSIDNSISSYSETEFQRQPWININTSSLAKIKRVKLVGQDPQNFYIFFSKEPFQSKKISDLLWDPWVDYVHVSDGIPLGGYVNVPGFICKHVLIVSPTKGSMQWNNISFCGEINPYVESVDIGLPCDDCPGGGTNEVHPIPDEICNNGIDDDDDGRTDCEDPTCGVGEVNIKVTNPSCPLCNDGSICIISFFANEVSLDGGLTFSPMTGGSFGETCFNNLFEGTYSIITRRSSTGCESLGLGIQLISEGWSGSDCGNVDFEYGDFTNWAGQTGTYNGNINNVVNGLDVPVSHEIVSTAGFADPNVPALTAVHPSLGNFITRLGNTTTGGELARLTYCFDVDNLNNDLAFVYAFVADEPGHEEPPFFNWRYYIASDQNQTTVMQGVNISSEATFLTDGPAGWEYTPFDCHVDDLSQFIGSTVCVEFTASGCGHGGHAGYAYIDVQCGSTGALPIAAGIDITNTAQDCDGVQFNIVGQGEFFNTSSWKITRISKNGNVVNSVTTPPTISQSPSLENVVEYYENVTEETFLCDEQVEIELTLINSCGIATVVERIDVPCITWKAWKPNTFSPNGDGINDLYHTFLNATNNEPNQTTSCSEMNNDITTISYFKMRIYDRWGNLAFDEEAFDTNSNLDGSEVTWDGTFNGQAVNPGVFAYQVLVETCGRTMKCNDCDNDQFCPEGNLITVEDHQGNDHQVEVYFGDVTVTN